MENQVDISRLITAYLNRTISDLDMKLLEEWLNESEANRERLKTLSDTSELSKRLAHWSKAGGDKDKAWELILERRQQQNQAPVKQIPSIRKFWQVAAAILVVIVGTATYFTIFKPSGPNVVTGGEEVSIAKNDVQPGSSIAILKLSDGTSISVDSIQTGFLAKQGDVEIMKADGSISYVGTGNTKEVLYNTLLVPKGGQYRLLLRDGTKVFLNSASSIRYPTVFKSGMERSVEITGEVYLEVAKVMDEKGRIPFVVSTLNGVKVEVLGTHFNINAYPDEPTVTTTLIEGKVKVNRQYDGKINSVILNTGEQSISSLKTGITINRSPDIQSVMAWKNGSFYFKNSDFASVMRQISRWYNIDIVYEGKIPTFKINGEANRSVSLANLLSMFASTDIKCRIDRNKLIIPEQ